MQSLGEGMFRVIGRFGFMERPNVIKTLRAADSLGLEYQPEVTTYVVGRENPVFSARSDLPMWRRRLFALMGRNSQLAAIHFGVPEHRTLEVGSQIKL